MTEQKKSDSGASPKPSTAVVRATGAALSPARAAARAVPRAAAAMRREVALLPARSWLLAERVAVMSARATDVGDAVSELLETVWEMASESEARIRHVQNTPLGPEHTKWVLSPKVEALIAAGLPPEEAQLARAAEPMVTMQTGGLLSSQEAVAIEVDVPESKMLDVIQRLEKLGTAGRELAGQLAALPAHALPLNPARPEMRRATGVEKGKTKR